MISSSHLLKRALFQVSVFVGANLSAIFFLHPVHADTVRQQLFKGAYLSQSSAKNNQAVLLAPENFAAGMKALVAAEKAYSKDKPIEKVRQELVTAISYFDASNLKVERARKELAAVLSARAAATEMNARKFSDKRWQRAENLFEDAVLALEADKLKKAKTQEQKAILIYREVELVAIKAEHLTETRRLIAKAEEAKIGKQAPKTLRKARSLLATAEVELTENRYDLDLPRNLATEARYEAKHAFYISEKIKRDKKQDLSQEDLILASEEPMQQVAAAADINARFDAGFAPVTTQMIDYIDGLRDQLQEANQTVADKELQIAGLRDLLQEFAELYGGAGTSVADLESYLANQESLLERVRLIESMFDRDEARVFRDAREVYIRLTGLSFDSGRASIRRQNEPLLAKVIEALKLYPKSRIVVEGHTDSFGGDDSNLILSRNRAESIRNYLLSNTSIQSTMLDAIGLGETKPFANNDTPQGRALNRRIDIRILPQELEAKSN